MKQKNTDGMRFPSYAIGMILLHSLAYLGLALAPIPLLATENSFPETMAVPEENHPHDSVLPPELAKMLSLTLQSDKTEAYPGELIGLSIKLSCEGIAIRDVQFPRLSAAGLSVGTFAEPMQNVETLSGSEIKTLVFKATAFGSEAGEFRLGPAQLQLSLLLPSPDRSDAFFGGQKTSVVNIASDAIPLRIKSFPEAGKPPDFSGSAGNFDLAVEIRPAETSVDAPLSVLISITGKGSLRAVSCPVIRKSSGFTFHESVVARREGVMTCEQILMPLLAGEQEVPAVTFSFFDPEVKSYRRITKGPFPILVTAPAPERRGSDTTDEKEAKDWPLSENGAKLISLFSRNQALLISCLILSIMCALLLLVLNRQRDIIKRHIAVYKRRSEVRRKVKKGLKEAKIMIGSGDSLAFFTLVFRTLQEYLGYLGDVAPTGITVGNIDLPTLPYGLDAVAVEQIKTVFTECDRARYALREADRARMEETLAIMMSIIRRKVNSIPHR